MVHRSSRDGCVLAALLLLTYLPASGSANTVYDAACAFCHQKGAVGLQGQFPRLAGRVDVMAANPAARMYLIQTVMFGSSGKIEVDGASFMGVMPPFASLSDAEIADVLNQLIRLAGKPAKRVKPISVEEVKAVRDAPRLTSTEVSAHRKKLVADKAIP
jgi:mono/diheme cytochrome c family protein